MADLAFFLDYCVGMIDLCYFPLQTDSSKKNSTICNAAMSFFVFYLTLLKVL